MKKKATGVLLASLVVMLSLSPGYDALREAPDQPELLADIPLAAAVGGAASTGGVASAVGQPGSERPGWRADQVLVMASEGASVAAVAADFGVEVLREGRGGAALSVPDGMSTRELIAALQGDERLRYAGRQGVAYGAGDPRDYQWHMETTDFDETEEADVSGYVVAVLDTGVAYEDHADASGSYIVAPSLAQVSFVAPYDFVNSDEHPNDDHQHGTHITSIIASQGDLPGVVPGVAIMPLKVLDANNSGTELDLVEAIFWAVDHGADVINMSLTFGEGYAPSPGMQAALEAAAAAGVVMVGAVGNDARSEVGWPAASPLVIAVGSGCQDDNADEEMDPAPYTNRGVQVDILAPGGCVDRDVGDDGVPDGVIAETISFQDPGETGYWLYAGTSQAAAVVSGAVVRMLEAGATPENARLFIQDKADTDPLENGYFVDGLGPGQLDIEDSIEKVQVDPDKFEYRRYHAAILPWLADSGGGVTPTARLTVLEHDFDEADEIWVYGRIIGETTEVFTCFTDDDGSCVVSGETVGHDEAAGWQIVIDRIVRGNESYPPGVLMFASEGLEQISDSMISDEELEGAVLGVHWEDGAVSGLGPVAESLVVLNAGTGIATSPIGIIITPKLLEGLGEEVSLSGTGIATSPIGMRRIDLSGTGIATSPLGLIKVVAFSGTGIATSPFSAISTLSLKGAEDEDWDDDHFRGEPIGLSNRKVGDLGGDDFEGCAIDAALSAGGWVTRAGQDGATAVAGSGMLSENVEAVGSGAGLGAVPFDE